MEQYQHLLYRILKEGTDRPDRTGTGTLSVFGHQSRYDLSQGFPLVTTKKMLTKGVIEELLWFIRGSTDVTELQEKGVHFWDSWVMPDGTIGEGYGKQMRSIEYYKQVTPMKLKHHGEVHHVRVVDQATEQLTRAPYPLPQMHLNQDITNIDDFTYDDIMLTDYQAHPHIRAEVAV